MIFLIILNLHCVHKSHTYSSNIDLSIKTSIYLSFFFETLIKVDFELIYIIIVIVLLLSLLFIRFYFVIDLISKNYFLMVLQLSTLEFKSRR